MRGARPRRPRRRADHARTTSTSCATLGGVVDYVVGAKPGPGVFVLATHDDPKQRHYLNLYKLGEGPLYSFYTPYHLCHFEVPHDGRPGRAASATPTIAPAGRADGRGRRHRQARPDGRRRRSTGSAATTPTAWPSGPTSPPPSGCCRWAWPRAAVLLRDVAKDEVLTYDDVELPAGRLVDELREEQARL